MYHKAPNFVAELRQISYFFRFLSQRPTEGSSFLMGVGLVVKGHAHRLRPEEPTERKERNEVLGNTRLPLLLLLLSLSLLL